MTSIFIYKKADFDKSLSLFWPIYNYGNFIPVTSAILIFKKS